jgi:hypothetical protein
LKNPKARIATGKIEQDRSLAMKMLFDSGTPPRGKTLHFSLKLLTAISSSEFFLRYFHFSYICFSLTEWNENLKSPQK